MATGIEGISPVTATDSLEIIARASVAITEHALRSAGARSLSLQQWRAIGVVAETEDGIRISAVARRVDVTVPATSRLLHRLAARNLISLEPDADGSTAQVALLTRDGRTLVEDSNARRRRVLAEIASRLQGSGAAHVLAELAAVMDELVVRQSASDH